MVAKKKASTGKKLKVKKETIKDLDGRDAKGVRGGFGNTRICNDKSGGCYTQLLFGC